MTDLSAASLPQRTPPAHQRSLADTIHLIEQKSPKHAAAFKVIADMVLEDLISAEQSPH